MLRVLANENIPFDVVDCLRAAGHDVTWIRAEAPGLNDFGVLALAERERRTLLTFDKDFGELTFRCRLPAECGVILARLRPTAPRALAETILTALTTRDDWAGHFTVIEAARIRMTPIPRNANLSLPSDLARAGAEHDVVYVLPRRASNRTDVFADPNFDWRSSNRFTQDLRQAFSLAEAEAQNRRHAYVGTEHLLFGVALAGNAKIVDVLAAHAIQAPVIRDEIGRFVRDGTEPVSHRPALTPRATAVMRRAMQLAEELGAELTGSEHAMIAIVEETDGVAAAVLTSLGARLESLKESLRLVAN